MAKGDQTYKVMSLIPVGHEVEMSCSPISERGSRSGEWEIGEHLWYHGIGPFEVTRVVHRLTTNGTLTLKRVQGIPGEGPSDQVPHTHGRALDLD